ncbi:MAG: tetratricopeptide repeat protein, partial [Candidatus Zixiibacteriota bacterium]
GQFAKAVEHTQKASEMDPGNPWVNMGFGVIYAAQGKRDDALKKFDEVRAGKLLDEHIYEKIVALFALLNDREEVYRWAREGLAAFPFIWLLLECNRFLDRFRQEPEFQKFLAEAKEKILNSE